MEDKKEENGKTCACGSYCMCRHGRHPVMRMVFMIIAIIIVFYLGIQLGELRGELRVLGGNSYEHGMMGSYGHGGYHYGSGMMGSYSPNGASTPAVPAVPSTTAPTAPATQ